MTNIEEVTKPMFVRKEREHLAVMKTRLEWLTTADRRPAPKGGYTVENGFIPGEAFALSWAISVLEGSLEPLEIRMERFERTLRTLNSRIGRLENEFEEDDD